MSIQCRFRLSPLKFTSFEARATSTWKIHVHGNVAAGGRTHFAASDSKVNGYESASASRVKTGLQAGSEICTAKEEEVVFLNNSLLVS